MNLIEALNNHLTKQQEARNIEELRMHLKDTSNEMKVRSIAGSVASMVSFLFGLLFSSTISTPFFFGVGIVGIVFSLDGWSASRKAAEIASKPSNFLGLHILKEEDKQKHFQDLIHSSLERTLLLKYFIKL